MSCRAGLDAVGSVKIIASAEVESHIIHIDSILTALNNKQRAGGIFCDIQKAFDCVNHKILLDKFNFYGIHGKFFILNRIISIQ
jgi:hypothetical protein